MLDEHYAPPTFNGSDGTFRVPEGTTKADRMSFSRRVNRRLNDYSPLITAITGLTVAVYILIDVVKQIQGVG